MENNTFISLNNLSEFKTLMDQDIDKKLHEYTIFTGSGTTLAEAFNSQAYQIYLALQESDKVALDYTCTSNLQYQDGWKTATYYYVSSSGDYHTFKSKDFTLYGRYGDNDNYVGYAIPQVSFRIIKYSDRDDAYFSSESFSGLQAKAVALPQMVTSNTASYIPQSLPNPVTLQHLKTSDYLQYNGWVNSTQDLPKLQQTSQSSTEEEYIDITHVTINDQWASRDIFYWGRSAVKGYKYYLCACGSSASVANDGISILSNNAGAISGVAARVNGNDFRMAVKVNASEEYPVVLYIKSYAYYLGGWSQIHYIDDDTDELLVFEDNKKIITRPFYWAFKNSTDRPSDLRIGTNIPVISAATVPNLLVNTEGSTDVFFASTENINVYKYGSWYYNIGDTIMARKEYNYVKPYNPGENHRAAYSGLTMTVGPKKDLYILDAAYNWKKVADTPEPTAKGIMTEGCVLYNVTANGYNGLKDWLNQRKEEVISAINNGNPFTIFFNDTNLNGENKTGTYIQRYYKRYNSNWDYYYIILYGSNISFSDTSSSHTYSNITISNNTLMITLKKNPETQEYTDIDVSYVATPGDNYKILNYLSPTSQNDNSYFTPTYKSQPVSKGYLDTVIQGINQFKREIVQELPTQDIDVNTIYMVPKTTTGTNNAYDEYLYINQSWEKIGDTEIDLSNYLAKDNTTSYTPSADYNPATKKYVDDKVGIPSVKLTANTDLRTSTLLPVGDYYLIKGSYILTYSYSDMDDNDHVYTFTNIPNDGCLFHVGSKNDFSIDELVASWENLDTGTKYAVIKDGAGTPTLYGSTMVDIENDQTITGKKTFSTLPESSVAPTTDGQLANKKYVDDSKDTILSNIAPTYDKTQTYNEGDYVIYNSQLYVCNTDIQIAEDFDSTKWDTTTVAEILGNIKTLLGAI